MNLIEHLKNIIIIFFHISSYITQGRLSRLRNHSIWKQNIWDTSVF